MYGYFNVLTIIIIINININIYVDCDEEYKVNRVAVFPQGSTFTVAMCVTLKLMTPDYDIFTEAFNWALTYDLPDIDNDNDNNTSSSFPPVIARKKRARFYSKLETLISRYGMDGRGCVLRALCEVTHLYKHKSQAFIEKIMKIVFRMPVEWMTSEEPLSHFEYDKAFRKGKHSDRHDHCAQLYSICPISILSSLIHFNKFH